MIPELTRSSVLGAMADFDSSLRDTSEWLGWEQNNAHKYAIDGG